MERAQPDRARRAANDCGALVNHGFDDADLVGSQIIDRWFLAADQR